MAPQRALFHMRSTKSDYLQKLPRSENWYYVRDVPRDLRSALGRSKWKRSTKTAVRNQAARIARAWAVEDDHTIDSTRRRLARPQPDSAQLAALTELDAIAAEIQHVETERVILGGDPDTAGPSPFEAFAAAHGRGSLADVVRGDDAPNPVRLTAQLASNDALVSSLRQDLV
ncbi:DUF6538 domain-containing protein [Alsobacter sp. SYSU BS001988]